MSAQGDGALIAEAGFILAGSYPEAEPALGLEQTLRLFELGEDLGFQVAGVRQRHLERGVSSALPFLGAATQRTRAIRLETDVVPLGYETPFRLAEDFATIDALSGGRLNAGISTSSPHGELLRSLARTEEDVDAYALIDRFLEALEGNLLADEAIYTPYGPQPPRIQPHVRTLRDRVWLGGGSLRSIRWAAARGLKLLLGNVANAADGGGETFEAAQRAHIDAYREAFAGPGEPAVGVERVIVPLDSATAAQRAHYSAYAAARDERTRVSPIPGLVFQRDLVGTSAEIVDRLRADPSIDGRTALRVALPYAFEEDDYRQILSDVRHAVLPELGWEPAGALAGAAAA